MMKIEKCQGRACPIVELKIESGLVDYRCILDFGELVNSMSGFTYTIWIVIGYELMLLRRLSAEGLTPPEEVGCTRLLVF